MPTYQKISLDGSQLVFNVTSNDGVSEICTYMLDGKETEEELMTRVALHIQSEKDKMQALNEAPQEPVMEVIVSDGGKVSVKEASAEPVE